jgi:IS30 family transposase
MRRCKGLLNLENRQIIEQMIKERYSHAKIAELLDRGQSHISREIRNHSVNGLYNAIYAEEYSKESRKRSAKRISQTKIELQKERDIPYSTLKVRVENLEMQIEILTDTIKELLNGKN